jgi:NodT family efflux transporter outer membrane factor (OMF) lipoprotein
MGTTLSTMRAGILAIAAAATIAGCAVGPDFKRPASPQVKGYTPEPLPAQTAAANTIAGDAQRFVQDMEIPAQWWALFHSQPLNTLVEQSLKANPGLQAAQAALRVAQENLRAQRGVFYPAVDANFSPTRQKIPGIFTSPLNSNATIFNLYTAQVNVSYMPDVFGGNRRQTESVKALADFQRFQLEATYLTLTSNVVAAAVQEASLRGQIAALQSIVKIDAEQLELVQRQYELGDVSAANVAAQKALLAQAQGNLVQLQKQLALQRDLLTALAGRFPSEEVTEKFELASLQLPSDLPVSLPSKLVEQRPDVRAAEEQLHAASAQIGVAVSNMLPQFMLTASAGSVATSLSDLFTSGSGLWSLAAGVTQPIFQGGALLHRKRAAEAAYDETAALYRSTVITAFQNVADTLRALQYDADALSAATTAEQAAAESLDLAREQMRLGDISYLALLAAEQTYMQALVALVQAQANRYADTVALFQALGGGWWNRGDTISYER